MLNFLYVVAGMIAGAVLVLFAVGAFLLAEGKRRWPGV
jgi:hypothetical protein